MNSKIPIPSLICVSSVENVLNKSELRKDGHTILFHVNFILTIYKLDIYNVMDIWLKYFFSIHSSMNGFIGPPSLFLDDVTLMIMSNMI